MNDDKDFSNEPETITHIKARKTKDGSVWTPRDAVVDWLREYDKGNIKECDTLVIIYRHKEDNQLKHSIAYQQSSQDNETMIGTVDTVKHRILSQRMINA